MHLQIRKFEELSNSALHDIMKLRCEVYIVEQHCPYADIDGNDEAALHMMCRSDDGGLAGTLRILSPGVTYDTAAIGRVAVSPACRGLGYAREMMKTATYYTVKRLGHRTIKIGAQDYLRSFYASLGFSPISEVYLEDDIPHIDMIYEAENDNR